MKNNFLYLLLISFVFISTTAMSFNTPIKEKIIRVLSYGTVKEYPELPVLNEDSSYPILSAQSAMAVDLDSGVTLYEKDPNKPLLPASTTKIVTALVAMDTYQLDQVLKVGVVRVDGQDMDLVYGEEITFENLLKGLLIFSANDAAEVLASNHPGGRDFFIALMNKKAKDLGLVNTRFANPTGLDNAMQYSTTKDLVVVSKEALKNPVFSNIVSTKEAIVKSVDGRYTHRLVNINKLLGVVPGVLGVKTGWTENARENLVTYVEKDGRRVMIAVLGSSDRFGETEELIEWIFESYTWSEVNPYSIDK